MKDVIVQRLYSIYNTSKDDNIKWLCKAILELNKDINNKN